MVSRSECRIRWLEATGFAQEALRQALSNDPEDVEYYSKVYNVNDHTNVCEWFTIAEMWYRLT
jgi:hypothetical protein